QPRPWLHARPPRPGNETAEHDGFYQPDAQAAPTGLIPAIRNSRAGAMLSAAPVSTRNDAEYDRRDPAGTVNLTVT
ncbi:MAG TPA: hypothetical protein VHY37_13755, partial [Tepidisphaeraceae bacterium]|nr:hypothetical protein [Tepidisphaeraceae bacterium]